VERIVSQRTETKTVADNPRKRRYEIHLDGELAGYCTYQRRPGTIVFTHTEVEPRFRGRGVGSRLIAAALADAERQDLRVVPRCEFVQDFIRRGPDPVAAPASSL
jgi:predicted GNAT family acetyltransferase